MKNIPPASTLKRLKAMWSPNMYAMGCALDGELRIVGGAVRDTICDRKVNDFDFCTPFTPDLVAALLKKALGKKIDVIPTGIDHGTVSVYFRAEKETFEITTLRQDVETDGRHAKVEFVTDYREDAARRDFTINAMMVDMQGNLYDWFGGYEDLMIYPVVRFVGDAEKRIREDYLRIFRWFRFAVRFSTRVPAGLLETFTMLSPGLSKISPERIWSETRKLLMSTDYVTINHMLNRMVDTDVAIYSCLFTPRETSYLKDPRVKKLIPGIRRYKTPETRLAYLWNIAYRFDNMVVPSDSTFGTEFEKRIRKGAEDFRMSAQERDRILYVNTKDHYFNRKSAEWDILNGVPQEWVAEALSVADANRNVDHLDISTWVAPKFPVSGADLIARGMKPGPAMGKVLAVLKKVWFDTGYEMTKSDLMEFME